MKRMGLILAGWLMDGKGSRTQKDVALETRDGHILRIRKMSPEDRARNDVNDYSHCTLLPLLVDSHVHLSLSGTDDPVVRQRQRRASYGEARSTIESNIQAHLTSGVFAVRDGGDYGGYTRRYKREALNREHSPLEVRVAGKGWHAPFRYGRLIGRTPIPGQSLARSVSRTGGEVDHVKIVNSGLISLDRFGKETSPQFNLTDLATTADRVHRSGLKLMVHANGELPVRMAIEAGCDSIEHGFFMGRENLMRIAEKGIFWVPTAFTMGAYARASDPGSKESEVARRNLEHQLEQLRVAEEYGVRIALGTDAGSVGVNHGKAVLEEMKMFISAGLSVERTVRCATSRGAELLNLEARMGTLAPGRPSSFLAVRGGPDRLPDSLNELMGVYIEGRRKRLFNP